MEYNRDYTYFCYWVDDPLGLPMVVFHRVLGIPLPPSDANHPFHCNRGLAYDVKKKASFPGIISVDLVSDLLDVVMPAR